MINMKIICIIIEYSILYLSILKEIGARLVYNFFDETSSCLSLSKIYRNNRFNFYVIVMPCAAVSSFSFRKTKAMDKIIEEKQKRRKETLMNYENGWWFISYGYCHDNEMHKSIPGSATDISPCLFHSIECLRNVKRDGKTTLGGLGTSKAESS